MDLHKIPTEEIRGFDVARRREVEVQIRRDLLQIRMDIFSSKAQHSAKIRGLKRTLARILTVGNGSVVVAPKAAKTVKAAPVKKAPAKTAVKAKKTETKK